MDIYRCQKIAEDKGFDSMEFNLVGPAGIKKCKWLDAYFGFFQIEGAKGFNTVAQIADIPGISCELISQEL